MMSVMVVGGETMFLSLKDVTNTCTCKRLQNSQTLRDFFSVMAESWKKLKTSNVVSLFIV